MNLFLRMQLLEIRNLKKQSHLQKGLPEKDHAPCKKIHVTSDEPGNSIKSDL